jgi:hypothetical protein
MRHRTIASLAASALVLLGTLAGLGTFLAPASQAKVVTATASTKITNRPDGGNHDNATQGKNQTWANDNFTRTATVTLIGEVARSHCPVTGTGHCYLWDARITDKGTFTTNPTTDSGSSSPRAGKPLDTPAQTGAFSGGSQDVQFYSSWKTPTTSTVPKTENDGGLFPSGKKTTTNWVEQFFGSGALFYSAANSDGPDLGDWSWTYTLGFGTNTACPNDAYQWVDAAANNAGQDITAGDILTPSAADCT